MSPVHGESAGQDVVPPLPLLAEVAGGLADDVDATTAMDEVDETTAADEVDGTNTGVV